MSTFQLKLSTPSRSLRVSLGIVIACLVPLALNSLSSASESNDSSSSPSESGSPTPKAPPSPTTGLAPERFFPGTPELKRTIPKAIRGVTVGPIENAMHSSHGYGTEASEETFKNVAKMGGTWVSLTPFARVWDLDPSGLDLTFETPYPQNRINVRRAIEQAHSQGLKVMLVPHLWVESGEWRALIDPKTSEGWRNWQQAYRQFLFTWAALAQETGVELLSVGVELRSWVSTKYAQDFVDMIDQTRGIYTGPITYAANWDDVEHTAVLSALDVIGINAFYPLAKEDGANFATLLKGGQELKERVRKLSLQWQKPILFTEFGYTARDNPAIKPWEWPESMNNVNTNGQAQADAYAALLSSLVDEPWFLGFFVWRFYADHYDASQEPAWGFSPLHRPAEQVLRGAFATHWAWDGPGTLGSSLWPPQPQGIGLY